MSTHKKINHGFTLLELLVVLAIAALLATLARPMFSAAVPGAKLRAEVLDLAVSLRASRNDAVSSSRRIGIVFDVEESKYTINDKEPVAFSSGIEFLAGALTLESLPHQSSKIPEYELKFYPDGSSTGASIELRNSAAGYRVDVDWLTGRVRVAEIGDDAS